jgi:hypothetical protein
MHPQYVPRTKPAGYDSNSKYATVYVAKTANTNSQNKPLDKVNLPKEETKQPQDSLNNSKPKYTKDSFKPYVRKPKDNGRDYQINDIARKAEKMTIKDSEGQDGMDDQDPDSILVPGEDEFQGISEKKEEKKGQEEYVKRDPNWREIEELTANNHLWTSQLILKNPFMIYELKSSNAFFKKFHKNLVHDDHILDRIHDLFKKDQKKWFYFIHLFLMDKMYRHAHELIATFPDLKMAYQYESTIQEQLKDILAHPDLKETRPFARRNHDQFYPDKRFLSLNTFNLNENSVVWVDFEDIEMVHQVLDELEAAQEIGIDCEWKPMGKPKLSIIQIATYNYIFLFDVKSFKSQNPEAENFMFRLRWILENPNIYKICLGDGTDLKLFCQTMNRVVQDYSQVFLSYRYMKGLQVVAKGGLSAVVEQWLGKPLDKHYQISNWDIRPLSKGQLHYAAMDAYVLLELYRVIPLDQQGAKVQTQEKKTFKKRWPKENKGPKQNAETSQPM